MSDCCHLGYLLNISENTWPIKCKLDIDFPWDGGTKVCSTDHGHMTKMATKPVLC